MVSMKTEYLIRLDDACPFMRKEQWNCVETLLDKYGVKPLVGIIPDAKDELVVCDNEDPDFWGKALKWQEKGWAIALHGYDHIYISEEGGVNPLWKRSEYAGVPLERQKDKIREGLAILKNKGLKPHYFFAPSHTFDKNTLEALKSESDIRIISDTIGRYPYKKNDFVFIPQIFGHCVKIPLSGIYTFCFHPNSMSDGAFMALERFLERYRDHFTNFDSIDIEKIREKSLLDKFISVIFFGLRKTRGLE